MQVSVTVNLEADIESLFRFLRRLESYTSLVGCVDEMINTEFDREQKIKMFPAAYVSILQILLYQSHVGAVFFYSETSGYDELIKSLKLKLPEVCLFNLSEVSTKPLIESAKGLATTVFLDFSHDSYNISQPIKSTAKQLRESVIYKLLLDGDCNTLNRKNATANAPTKFNGHKKILLCQERISMSSSTMNSANSTSTASSFQLLTESRKPVRLVYDKSITDTCGRIGFNTSNMGDFLTWLRETHYTKYCQNSCRGKRKYVSSSIKTKELIEACSSCYRCIGCETPTLPNCYTNKCPALPENKYFQEENERARLRSTIRLLIGLIGETILMIVCSLYFRKHGLTSYKNGHLHIRVICLSFIFSTTLLAPLKLFPIVSKAYYRLNTIFYHLLIPSTLLDTPHLALIDLKPNGRLSQKDHKIMISNYILAVSLSVVRFGFGLELGCLTLGSLNLYIQLCYSGLCVGFLYLKYREQIENLKSKIAFSVANYLALLVTIHDWTLLNSNLIHHQKLSSVLMILSACVNFLVRNSKRSMMKIASTSEHQPNNDKKLKADFIKTISLTVSNEQKQESPGKQFIPTNTVQDMSQDESVDCARGYSI